MVNKCAVHHAKEFVNPVVYCAVPIGLQTRTMVVQGYHSLDYQMAACPAGAHSTILQA